MRTEVQINVGASASTVWDVMSDVEKWPTWTASVKSVEALDGPALRVGARFRVTQPRLPRAVWEVTDVRPGRAFTWVNRSPGLESTATHAIESRGPDASQVSLSIEQVGALSFLVRPYRRLTQRYVDAEAAGLKRRSEQLPILH